MADPEAGWRELLKLLRPDGLMRVGLYSELGRRELAPARGFIAERNYRPIPDDIRRCRQELADSPVGGVARFNDFFSMSECRDLMFHVQEHRLTIPQIASFLGAHDLTFLGFETDGDSLAAYRQRFPEDRALTDLDRWHKFECERPDTFIGMYQFMVQRTA